MRRKSQNKIQFIQDSLWSINIKVGSNIKGNWDYIANLKKYVLNLIFQGLTQNIQQQF